jgi:hypothetical protein
MYTCKAGTKECESKKKGAKQHVAKCSKIVFDQPIARCHAGLIRRASDQRPCHRFGAVMDKY